METTIGKLRAIVKAAIKSRLDAAARSLVAGDLSLAHDSELLDRPLGARVFNKAVNDTQRSSLDAAAMLDQ